jgi:hypothetical protein
MVLMFLIQFLNKMFDINPLPCVIIVEALNHSTWAGWPYIIDKRKHIEDDSDDVMLG